LLPFSAHPLKGAGIKTSGQCSVASLYACITLSTAHCSLLPAH